MCCSAQASVMSNTRLYVGEAEKDGKTVHVLAYQNEAGSSGPNAMIIPFPTNVKMAQDNVIDTSKFKDFLTNITDASKHLTKGFGRLGMTLGSFDSDSLAEVFEVGSYTVVLAEHTSQISEALKRVPTNKRPQISTDFLKGYAALYPNQPVAVCCWSGEIEAEPLLWWYEPIDTTKFFIPTMDAHDGRAPVLGTLVATDHIISVGSVGPTNGHEVHYTDKIPAAVKDLLPTHVHGHRLPHRMENADCFVKTSSLHATRESYFSGSGERVELQRGLDYQAVMNGWS